MEAVGIIFIMAGIILSLAGLGQIVQNKSFIDSEFVTGIVIDKRKRDRKNGTSYEITVKYIVNGNEYSKVVGVTLSNYKQLSEGDKFELKYRPDKPYKAINPEALNPKKARVVLIVGAIMGGVGIIMLLI